jgi:hypothetical protein
MAKAKNYGARKSSGNHTTLIDASRPVVAFLERCPLVTKYAEGIIVSARSKRRRIKAYRIPVGLKLVVYGSAYFQEIYVTVQPVEAFEAALRETFGSEYLVQFVG